MSASAEPPLPTAFGVRLDDGTHVRDGGRLLWHEHGATVMRLTAAGAAELPHLLAGPPLSERSARLGRRLVDAGLAHPVPPDSSDGAPCGDVTVVVPVRDRAEMLDRCLGALGSLPVVVVDDASQDAAAIAHVCRMHEATLVRRERNGGPAAARNDGIEHVTTSLVAFVDSDCVVPSRWLDALVGHFADPTVAAVAPRVRPASGDGSVLARYLEQRSLLDMGPRPGAVRPFGPVPYVPTAALVARRSVVVDCGAFDEALRCGEDVDAVWRWHDAGWRVRYEPALVVAHTEPSSWSAALGRRFRYGASAGPLALRHPGRLTPVIVHPVPGAVVAGVASGSPLLAAAGASVGGAALLRRLRARGLPDRDVAGFALRFVARTGEHAVRAAVSLAPLVVAAPLLSRRRRWWWASILTAPFFAQWWRARPRMDPARWTAARVVDEIAYGLGVWSGAARARTAAPLRPAGRHRET